MAKISDLPAGVVAQIVELVYAYTSNPELKATRPLSVYGQQWKVEEERIINEIQRRYDWLLRMNAFEERGIDVFDYYSEYPIPVLKNEMPSRSESNIENTRKSRSKAILRFLKVDQAPSSSITSRTRR